MAKVLLIEHSKCTACKRCELACSFKHAREFSPAKARISVVTFLEENFYMPITCLHCEEPICQGVCPAGAITKNPATGAVEILQDRCVGCKMCIMACPYGAPRAAEGTVRVEKCDLCAGQPECVAACNWGALEYVDADKATLAKRKRAVKKLKSALLEVKD